MHEYINDLHEIKQNMLEELVSYKQAKDITPDKAAQIKTLASGVEKLCHIIDSMEVGSSRRGMSRRGWYEGSYDGGSRRDGSYDGGIYDGGSYEDGASGRRGRDAMGRYTSRDSGFYDKLENLMQEAPSESERTALKDMIHRMRR